MQNVHDANGARGCLRVRRRLGDREKASGKGKGGGRGRGRGRGQEARKEAGERVECRARVAVEVVGRGRLFVYGMGNGVDGDLGVCVVWQRGNGAVQPAMPCSSRSSGQQEQWQPSIAATVVTAATIITGRTGRLRDGRVLEARGWWGERSGTDAQGKKKQTGHVPTHGNLPDVGAR